MKNKPSLLQVLVGRFVHKIPYRETRHCLKRTEEFGLPITYNDLAVHHLAGGKITSLVEGLIYAKQQGIEMSVQNAQARELVCTVTSKLTLTEHIKTFQAAGIRNLDKALLTLPPPSSRTTR